MGIYGNIGTSNESAQTAARRYFDNLIYRRLSMNELVQLTTQDVSNAIPITSSLIVAKEFEKQHKDVLKAIRNILSDIEDWRTFAPIYFVKESIYTDEYGREQDSYIMNEPFFMLLAMGFTGKKALLFKTKFIKAFMFMKTELQARSETRFIGKAVRHSLTDAIKYHMEDGTNSKKFAYGNYTKLVYKRILGMDVKHAKDLRKVGNGNLRDFLTIEELDKVQALESKIAAFIEISDTDGKDDKAVYAMVKTYVDSLTK